MAKNEHGWFAKLTGTIPNTPPPSSKREIQDIRDAHKGETPFKNMSDRQVQEWAKRNVGRDFEGLLPGRNRFGGRTVVASTKHADSVLLHHYDASGKYAGTDGIGRSGI